LIFQVAAITPLQNLSSDEIFPSVHSSSDVKLSRESTILAISYEFTIDVAIKCRIYAFKDEEDAVRGEGSGVQSEGAAVASSWIVFRDKRRVYWERVDEIEVLGDTVALALQIHWDNNLKIIGEEFFC
jgi:hypothetical protein